MVYNSKIRVQASVYLDQSSVLSLYIFQNKTFVSNTVCACVSVTQLCLTLCDPMDCSPPGSSVHGKNTGVGCHSLLQGIFLTQELNLGLLHCWWILYHLSHQESPTRVGVCSTIFLRLPIILPLPGT